MTPSQYDDAQEIKRLWLACFDDDEPFIDRFLAAHYDARRCEVARHDGGIAAMLHIVPFGETAYIYAVATDPSCRRRGLAGNLLRRAIARCRAEGFRYAALIPGSDDLRRWYAGFGFAGTVPTRFRTRDGFDFGTGDPARDRAMILPLADAPFTGGELTLSDLSDES